ncbi:MAG: pantoate--beta-alanine ligase [Weeksellaceae bacterium]
MHCLKNLKDAENLILTIKNRKQTIGFVPTMGALHLGHISLVNQSKKENDFTFVTVFVNPTQFNNADDLVKYPRTEKQDLALLEQAGVDAVFFPTVEDIYPNGELTEHFDFGGLENKMEGEFRPGHFEGVGTVVKRFFEIVQPDNAYFGEKDFQQLQIIRKMVLTQKLPVQIIPVAIKREEDGLAMSSRNQRLTPEMRKEAPLIFKVLNEAKIHLENHSIAETKKFVEKQFESSPLVLEYFEIAEENTLESAIQKSSSQKIRAFIAVYADEIRLIDNLSLN